MISGNTDDGVEISGSGTTGNFVVGSFISTNAAGTAAMSLTGTDGVAEIDTSASGNTVGGLTSTPGTGAGNVISGNTGWQVGDHRPAADRLSNVVEGNLIGTNSAGNAAIANSFQTAFPD